MRKLYQKRLKIIFSGNPKGFYYTSIAKKISWTLKRMKKPKN